MLLKLPCPEWDHHLCCKYPECLVQVTEAGLALGAVGKASARKFWQWASSVNGHVGLIVKPASLVFFLSLLFLKATSNTALSHSSTSVAAICFSIIYLCASLPKPGDWQKKPPWPHHSCAAKPLYNTQLQTEASSWHQWLCEPCAVFLVLALSLICWVHFVIWFQLACGVCLRMLCTYVFVPMNLDLRFILQRDFYIVMWFPQFIHHQWHLYFHLTGMSPIVWDTTLRERLRSSLWLVIDGVSAQLFSMRGDTWWFTSPWLFP